MTGDIIKEFLVGLGFQVDQQSVTAFNRGLAEATTKALVLGAAVTAAAGTVFAFVNHMAGGLDELSDIALRINSTAEAVDKLGYAASLNDSSVEAARATLDNLNRTAGQAALGLGRGKKYFDELGISVTDANGKVKNTTDLLLEVGETLKGIDEGKQRAILEGLGIDSTMLATITGGLQAVSAEVDAVYAAAGLDMNKAAADASDFKDELGKLQFTLSAMGKGIAARFMGPLREGMERMRKTLLENMPQIMRVVTPIIDLVLRIAGTFLGLASRVASVAGIIIGWIADIQDATNGWAGIILAVVAAWKYLNLAFLATPLGAVIALAAAIAMLVDDFLTFQEGGDSFFDWSGWIPTIDGVTTALGGVKDILSTFFDMAFRGIHMLVKLLTGDFAGAWRLVQEQVETFIGLFGKAWELIKSVGNIELFGGAKGPIMGNRAALTPSPAAAAAATAGAQNVNQQTQIVLQGSAATDANARAVAGAQRSVNADMARNMKGAAR